MLLQNERFLLISSVKSLCPNITKLSSLQMRNISLFRQDLFFIFSIMKLQMVSNSIFVVLMPLYSWRSQRQKSDFMGNRNLLPQKHYPFAFLVNLENVVHQTLMTAINGLNLNILRILLLQLPKLKKGREEVA